MAKRADAKVHSANTAMLPTAANAAHCPLQQIAKALGGRRSPRAMQFAQSAPQGLKLIRRRESGSAIKGVQMIMAGGFIGKASLGKQTVVNIGHNDMFLWRIPVTGP
jgi:hypothetical protein